MSRRAASPALVAARSAAARSVADLPVGSRFLVACSGGPDSLALVGASAWAAERAGLSAHAIVVDHGLQGDSGRVAEHAARTCLALRAAAADVVEVRVGSGSGPEGAARSARYSALAEAADRLSAPVVLIGHTREDQAETVLLRLARGSGARSLSAMSARADPWRRPFLALSRAEVRAAAAELLEPLGERPWQDPHNADPAYARVRVRAVLDELTAALGPGAVLGLSRSAELLRDDADLLDDLAAARFEALVDADGASCAELAGLPRALRTRVIRLMALRAGCPPDAVGFDLVRQVEELVVDWHGQGAVRLPGRIVASREYGRLCLRSPIEPPE